MDSDEEAGAAAPRGQRRPSLTPSDDDLPSKRARQGSPSGSSVDALVALGRSASPGRAPSSVGEGGSCTPITPSWDVEHDSSVSAGDVARGCFRPLAKYEYVHFFENSSICNVYMYADVIEGPCVPEQVNDFLQLVVDMRDMLSQGCSDKARFVFPQVNGFEIKCTRDMPTEIITHTESDTCYHEIRTHMRLARVVHRHQYAADGSPGSQRQGRAAAASQFRPVFFLVVVVVCPQSIHFRRGMSMLMERSELKRHDDAARRNDNRRALSAICTSLAEHFPHQEGHAAVFDSAEKLFSRAESGYFLTPVACMRGMLYKAAGMHAELGVTARDLLVEGMGIPNTDWFDSCHQAVVDAAAAYETRADNIWTTIGAMEENRRRGARRRRRDDADGEGEPELEVPTFQPVDNHLAKVFPPPATHEHPWGSQATDHGHNIAGPPLAIPSHPSVVLLYWRALDRATRAGERPVPYIPAKLSCMLIRDDQDWSKGGVSDVGFLNEEAERASASDSGSRRSRADSAGRQSAAHSSPGATTHRGLSSAVMMDIVMNGDANSRGVFDPLVQSLYKGYRRSVEAAVRCSESQGARCLMYRRLVGTLAETALIALKSETHYSCGELQATIECFTRAAEADPVAAPEDATLEDGGEDPAEGAPRSPPPHDSAAAADAIEHARRRLGAAMASVVGDGTRGLLGANAYANWGLSLTHARHVFNAHAFALSNRALCLDPLNLHLLVMIAYNRPFAMHDFQNGVVAAAPQDYGGTFWVCSGGGLYEKADGSRMLFKPYGCGFSYVQEVVQKLLHPETYGLETVAKFEGDAQMNSATTLAITMQHAIKTTTDMTSGRVTVSTGKKSKAARLWIGEMTDPAALFFYFNRDGARRVQETTEGSGGARNGNDSGRRLVRYYFVITPSLEAVTTNRFVNPDSDRPNAIAEVTRLTAASEQKSKSNLANIAAQPGQQPLQAMGSLINRCLMLDAAQLACLVANLQSEGVVGRVDDMLPSVRDIWQLLMHLLACSAEGMPTDPRSCARMRAASYVPGGADSPPAPARCLVLNHDPRRASRLENATRARAVARSTTVMSGAIVASPSGVRQLCAGVSVPAPSCQRPFIEYLGKACINVKFNPVDPATLPATICDYLDQMLRPAVFIPVFLMARDLATPVVARHALLEWFCTGNFTAVATECPELCKWWDSQCRAGNILAYKNTACVTLGTRAAPGQAANAPPCEGLHADLTDPVSSWCTQLANNMVIHHGEEVERANLSAELLAAELTRFVDRPQVLPALCGGLAATQNAFTLLGHNFRTAPFLKGPAGLRNTGAAVGFPAMLRIGHSFNPPSAGVPAAALPAQGRLGVDFRFFLWAVAFASDGIEGVFSRSSVSINSVKHIVANLTGTFFEQYVPASLFPYQHVSSDLPSRTNPGLIGITMQREPACEHAADAPGPPRAPPPPCTMLRRVHVVSEDSPRPSALPPSWQLHWDKRNEVEMQVLEPLSVSGVTEDIALCEVWIRAAAYLNLDRMRHVDRGLLICATRFDEWLPALDPCDKQVWAYRVDRPRPRADGGCGRALVRIVRGPGHPEERKQARTDDIVGELGIVPLPHVSRHGAVVLLPRQNHEPDPGERAMDTDDVDCLTTPEATKARQQEALQACDPGSRVYAVVVPSQAPPRAQWFSADGVYHARKADPINRVGDPVHVGLAQLLRCIVPYGSTVLVNFESLQYKNLAHCADRIFLRPPVCMARLRTPPFLWATLALLPEDDLRATDSETGAYMPDAVAVHAVECRSDLSVVGTHPRTTEHIVLHIVTVHDLACPEDVPSAASRGMYGVYMGKHPNWNTTQLTLAALRHTPPTS